MKFVAIAILLFSQISFGSQRDDRLNQLKEAQTSNQEAIEEIRGRIAVELDRMSETPFNLKKEKRTHANLVSIEEQIQGKIEVLKMRYGQVDFWDRIIFETERKYTGGDFKSFLEKNLLALAKSEALSPNGSIKTWKIFAFASWAVRNACEKLEDPVDCLSTQLVSRPQLVDDAQGKVANPQANKVEKKDPLKEDLENLFIRIQKTNGAIKTGQLERRRR